jgi:hypothetical protein
MQNRASPARCSDCRAGDEHGRDRALRIADPPAAREALSSYNWVKTIPKYGRRGNPVPVSASSALLGYRAVGAEALDDLEQRRVMARCHQMNPRDPGNGPHGVYQFEAYTAPFQRDVGGRL